MKNIFYKFCPVRAGEQMKDLLIFIYFTHHSTAESRWRPPKINLTNKPYRSGFLVASGNRPSRLSIFFAFRVQWRDAERDVNDVTLVAELKTIL
jgi:hypothetical protein